MKVLHLSFHHGCISDVQNVFTKLGCQIDYKFMKNEIPYTITESIANQVWDKNKDLYNSYDIIFTSDTVALSYIFLLHLNDLKPHLIILNSNRFSYGMEREYRFFELLQKVQSDKQYLKKITYIPYTDFERIWCGKFNIFLHERAIMPIGKYEQHINDAKDIIASFDTKNTTYRTKDLSDTIFLQKYHNHHQFMNLSKYLYDHEISVDFGSYVDLKELHDYKAMVILPDQFSKYFTFESIQEEVIIVMPSHKFLMELVSKPGYYFNIEGSSGRLIHEFVNLCEWYKYPEARIYFDSFEEMIYILKNLTPEIIQEKKKWCRFYGKAIQEEHLLQWKHILEKIKMHRSLSK